MKERGIHARFLARSSWQVLTALRPTGCMIALALGVLLAACGSTQSVVTDTGSYGGLTPDGGATPDGGQNHDGGPTATEITVSPTTADVYYGGRLQFAAQVTGSDQRVIWTVLEAGGGTISASGEYVAPGASGTFHVVVQSYADPSKSATATVMVRAPPGPADFVVNFTDVRQTMEGFGAADVWLGALSDAQMDLFFNPNNGIGLSILRMGIAPSGGSLSAWTNATRAAARGAQMWAVPWSPPSGLKDTGSTTTGRLLTAGYDSWATSLANYASSFRANTGINLYALSVQNEPDWDTNGAYDMCLYSDQQMHDFIAVLGPKLAALNPRPKLMAPEPSNWLNLWTNGVDGSIQATLADQVTAGYVDILATHQYANGNAAVPHALPPGKSLWETEQSSFEGFDPSIGNAVRVAQWIHDAIVNGGVSAWHYWWLIGQNADNEGLIGFSRNTTMTKRLYTMGNFSKFVRPGWVRIGTTGTKDGIYGVSAYKNPGTGNFAVVAIINSSAPVTLTLRISNATANSPITPYQTYDDGSADFTISIHGNLEPKASIPVASDGTFSATIPYGVTTFVGTGH